MIIVEQTAEELKGSPLERIELAGRTCYNSLGSMKEGSALPFVTNLIRRQHYTPTEQVAVKIPAPLLEPRMYLINSKIQGKEYPRNRLDYGEQIVYNNEFVQSVRGTARAFFELGIDPAILQDQHVVVDDDYVTIKFVTDRGIANEFIRHRALAYGDDGYPSPEEHEESVEELGLVQESTRYVNYTKKEFKVCRPVPSSFCYDEESLEYHIWYDSCESSYASYQQLCMIGVAPQIARNVLPLSTATTVVMSGYLNQWIALLNLRMPKDAQPQARYLGAQIFDILAPKLSVHNVGYNECKKLKELRDDIMSDVDELKRKYNHE